MRKVVRVRNSLIVILSWSSSLALAGVYLILGGGLDAALQGEPWNRVPEAIAAALLTGLCAWAASSLGAAAIAPQEAKTRRSIIAHVFALGPSERAGARAGRIINTATDGVERNAVYRATFIASMIASLTTPVLIVIIVALFLDPLSAGLLSISIPLVPASVLAFHRGFRPVSRRYRNASRALAAQELDAIQGLGSLVLMNAGRRMGEELARAAEEVRSKVMSYLAGNQLVLLVIDSVFTLGMITGATLLALARSSSGALSPGQGLALVLLSTIMLDPLDRIGQFFYIGMGGIAAGKEISRFTALVPASVDEAGVRAPTRPSDPGALRIDDVSFSYDGQIPILEHADLELRAGEKVALAGPSGAGKSTLSALLQGDRRPDSGRILIEGEDLRKVPLSWARSRIAVVEQTTYLFSGSLRDNLLLASPHAADEELLAALKTAELDDLMARLPEGLDTRVGSRGLALSGGEAQRVAIARALLKDAPILILDEPTAHVDLASEQAILAALEAATRGRTALTISHRQATIDNADRRVELHEGALR